MSNWGSDFMKLTRNVLGVLTHTTALDRLWGGDGTLTMWSYN